MDVAIHSFDPTDRNEVVLSVRTVFLRQFDRAASDVIDHPDLFATGRDDVHVLLDAGETGICSFCWAAAASLFLHEIDRFLGARGDFVATFFAASATVWPASVTLSFIVLAMIGLLKNGFQQANAVCHVRRQRFGPCFPSGCSIGCSPAVP